MNPVKHHLVPSVVLLVALMTSGCATSQSESAIPSPTSTQTESETPTPTPTRTQPADADADGVIDLLDDFAQDQTRSKQLRFASRDPVVECYPLVVDTAQLDSRLANWI